MIIELYTHKDNLTDIRAWANIAEGTLTITVIDSGSTSRSIWGGEDYEYSYSFSLEQTQQLEQLICCGRKLEEILKEKYSYPFSETDLIKKCNEANIKYKFFSWN